VTTEEGVPGPSQRLDRPVAVVPGLAVWLFLVMGSLKGWIHLGIIGVWLGFGLGFVFPLGLWQLRSLGVRLPPVPVYVAAATLGVISLAVGQGATAAVLALPWFATSLAAAGGGLLWLFGSSLLNVRRLLIVAALGYLAFGAAWLMASRLGLRPMGFAPDIVELTAVHFGFAGFAGPLIALATAEALAARSGRLATAALVAGVGVVAAMPG